MAQTPVVLVVEDEPQLRTVLCAALTTSGFTPYAAGEVDGALKILGSEHVDGICLDIRLPDPAGHHRNGLTLLRFLRATAEYAQIPVVILTGLPLSDAEESVAKAHDAHVFYKPQPSSTLIAHLNRLLGNGMLFLTPNGPGSRTS